MVAHVQRYFLRLQICLQFNKLTSMKFLIKIMFSMVAHVKDIFKITDSSTSMVHPKFLFKIIFSMEIHVKKYF